MTVTAKLKVSATPEVIRTIKAYKKGVQLCVDTAWRRKIRNNVRLHPFVYPRLRKTLPAQLAVACIKQACGIVKKAKTKPVIQRASVGYNFPRSANLKGNVLVLRLLKCRQTFALNVPACFQPYFDEWQVCESRLRMDQRGRTFFLFTFSKEVEAIKQDSRSQNAVLGLDLGVHNLAVTSDGHFFHSGTVKQAKRRFKYLRGKLQAKGTRSAKRLLRKISGRETRYMAWVNHNISKHIVANFDGNKIVMEDLKGIRNTRRGRRMNYWISNWSFFQLQNFVQYKAERRGMTVVRHRPEYTSQLCHRCGQIGSRLRGSFGCHCGLTSYSADLNAAKNLAHPMLDVRQAAVTRPYSRSHETEGTGKRALEVELMAKSP